MKFPDILNDPKYKEVCRFVRKHSRQSYPAKELAYIQRYLSGETTLVPGEDFSQANLRLIKDLTNN